MKDLNELIKRVNDFYSEKPDDPLGVKESFESRLSRLKEIVPDKTIFMIKDYDYKGEIVFGYAIVDYSYNKKPIFPNKNKFVVTTINREPDIDGLNVYSRGMYFYSLDEVDSLMTPDGEIFFRADSGLVESVYRLRWKQFEDENWPFIFNTSFHLTKKVFILNQEK